MARRKSPARPDPATGVVGLFERTSATWSVLGGPASLSSQDAAVAAWSTCARPSWSYDGFTGTGPGRGFVAQMWWQAVRPEFLRQREALTAAELAAWDRHPELYEVPGCLRSDAVDHELFGAFQSRLKVRRER
ncbi:hypothetical protein [Actinoplanes sp. NPDC051859]|uniref:hypothetical protein n=1 Tax=Actinoplanes sp. NPDC051859 TaxID=3363909 RepID=UPI0037A6F002